MTASDWNRSHPSEETLALYSGEDLALWPALLTRWHLRSCPDCRHIVQDFQSGSERLAQEMLTLPSALEMGRSWDSLSREMAANIRLGLAAGECVTPVAPSRSRSLAWRMPAAALATLAVAVALLSVHWMDRPQPSTTARAARGARTFAVQGSLPAAKGSPAVDLRLAASEDGISLQGQGASFTLLHDSGATKDSRFYTSSPDSLRVRYVDAKTGQVTINNVYAE